MVFFTRKTGLRSWVKWGHVIEGGDLYQNLILGIFDNSCNCEFPWAGSTKIDGWPNGRTGTKSMHGTRTFATRTINQNTRGST